MPMSPMRWPASPCSARWRCWSIRCCRALLHLSPRDFGLWSGASIHEIAQVVAAAFQDGPAAGQFGTVAKLTRVMMLAPLVIGLGLIAARKARGGEPRTARRPPMPWFVLGFIAVMLLNSVDHGGAARKGPDRHFDQFPAVDGAGGDGAGDRFRQAEARRLEAAGAGLLRHFVHFRLQPRAGEAS